MTAKKRIFVYFQNKQIVSTAKEGLNFISQIGFIPSNQNALTLNDAFSEEPSYYTKNYFELSPTGIGRNRILVYEALADTLEEHEIILSEILKVKNEEEKIRWQKIEQEWLNDAYTALRGWYEITIDYHIQDFKKGGYKSKTLNGRVIANSIIDAYHKGCQEIEKKNGEFIEDAKNALITYVGVLTDEYLLSEF